MGKESLQKDRRNILRFLHEAGQLKNVPRSGWNTVKAPHESVAEHSFRTAVVAHIMAKIAGLGKEEELLLIKAAIYHDLHEARVGDLHIISKKYASVDEKKCEQEQVEGLPEDIREDILACLNLPKKLHELLKDADKLECAIQAKEYSDLGYKTKDWIENTKRMLTTNEAKSLVEALSGESSLDWICEQRKK